MPSDYAKKILEDIAKAYKEDARKKSAAKIVEKMVDKANNIEANVTKANDNIVKQTVNLIDKSTKSDKDYTADFAVENNIQSIAEDVVDGKIDDKLVEKIKTVAEHMPETQPSNIETPIKNIEPVS